MSLDSCRAEYIKCLIRERADTEDVDDAPDIDGRAALNSTLDREANVEDLDD